MAIEGAGVSRVAEEIEALRRAHGLRALILGHHYQSSEVLRHADEIGDSLELSQIAAAHPEAERILFCGVRFMAESAALMAPPGQSVFLSNMAAGCPMADMADAAAVEAAWQTIVEAGRDWLPVVYVNSSADVKAFCGRWGGSTCTSSNAPRVFEWAFSRNRRVFFIPDRHLGENTARDLGLKDREVAVFSPRLPGGGLSRETLRSARVLVWKGFCHVHTRFTLQQVEKARAACPGARIIVHPESPAEVVRCCDAHGSTAQIIRYVRQAAAGTTVVIGTEFNLVDRLAAEQRGRVDVKALMGSVCRNMALTRPEDLLRILQTWPDGNRIVLDPEVVEPARAALRRMLEMS